VQIVLYLTHGIACGFEMWARFSHFEPSLLVGTNAELFTSLPPHLQYVYALYWVRLGRQRRVGPWVQCQRGMNLPHNETACHE